MEVLPINLTELLAMVLGMSVIIIPVLGLTLRFALKPTVEAFARLFEHKGLEETVAIMERRLDLMEAQVESIDQSVSRIADAVEFQADLQSGGPSRQIPGGSSDEPTP